MTHSDSHATTGVPHGWYPVEPPFIVPADGYYVGRIDAEAGTASMRPATTAELASLGLVTRLP